MDNPSYTIPDDRAHMWITGYFPNGFKASFTLSVSLASAFDEGMAFTQRLAAQGFTINPPGLESGEERELIMVVMRRAKGDGTPIIDFYPAWGAGGDTPYGTYKYVHKYLNDDVEIADFLAVSGFKSLDDIPLYDGQGALKRTPGKSHPKERTVPKPFYVVRKQGAEKIGSDGAPYRPWELLRYESEFGTAVNQSTGEIIDEKPATPKNKPAQLDPEQWSAVHWKALCDQFTPETVSAALQIQRGGQWDKSYATALEIVEKYVALDS